MDGIIGDTLGLLFGRVLSPPSARSDVRRNARRLCTGWSYCGPPLSTRTSEIGFTVALIVRGDLDLSLEQPNEHGRMRAPSSVLGRFNLRTPYRRQPASAAPLRRAAYGSAGGC